MDNSVRNVRKHNLSLCTESTIFGCFVRVFGNRKKSSLAEAETSSGFRSWNDFLLYDTKHAGSECDEWQTKTMLLWMAIGKDWPEQKADEKNDEKWGESYLFSLSTETMKTSIIFLAGVSSISMVVVACMESSHPYNKHKQFLHVLHQPILWHSWFFSFGRSFPKYAFCGGRGLEFLSLYKYWKDFPNEGLRLKTGIMCRVVLNF